MKDYEYEEENLDDFMVNAANILSEEDNPEKNTIIESLKQHLSSIFHIKNEMDNFFRTLNGVIFTSRDNSHKIGNKLPFLLYPIIFSFNPKNTSDFVDYYLGSLQQSINEDNRADFTFLSEIFSDVIIAFFGNEKNNKYLIQKNCLLEQNKKKYLYEKLFNFCISNIKINRRLEQSFGCLLLTEFTENCPLVKEEQNLESLFNLLSDYLDDRWFECKLDLLNCIISLIFSTEKKFKPYANICLFKVLDYLTDIDWMKRKLAVNIVYTLVFYCKEEVMAVKENIIEFLSTLKQDSIEEIREVCIHTLKFLGEEDIDRDEFEPDNDNNRPKNVYNKYNYNLNSKINKNKKNNIPFDKGDSQENSNQTQNIKKNHKNSENLHYKLQKQKEILEKMEKDFMEKKKNYSANANFKNNIIKLKNNDINNISISKDNNNTLNKEIIKQKSKQNIAKDTTNENIPNDDSVTTTINSILEQIKKIREEQSDFRQMLSNLKQTAGNNYINLNERLRALEKNSSKYKTNLYGLSNYNDQDYNDSNSQKESKGNKKARNYKLVNRSDEKIKIEELKEKFMNGNYNEALIESNRNDRYLLKLLPLMDKTIIPKIEIALLEDAISRINKRVPILFMEGKKESINDILLFYIQLLKSRNELKLVTQLSIRDTLSYLKINGNNRLNEEDKENIEKILDSLRV